jgi:hypothetical protein
VQRGFLPSAFRADHADQRTSKGRRGPETSPVNEARQNRPMNVSYFCMPAAIALAGPG